MNTTIPFDKLVPDRIQLFEPYIPSKPDHELMKLYGCPYLHRLNNNENPLGPPPEAQEIIRRFSPPSAAIYPSGDCFDLRRKLASSLDLNPEQILVGNGANETIGFVIKAFCQEGDNIITADKTFAVYEWVAKFSGIEDRLVPLVNYGFDREGILDRIDERTKLIFICNPNNPTGTYWNEKFLRSFLESIDCRQIVILDEAYAEFVEKDDYPDGIRLLRDYPNLVLLRTFSKMFALAGLRIGYLVGQADVVNTIRRTCIVYSVNTVAQAAAYAALENAEEHIRRTRSMIRESKEYVVRELGRMNLEFVNNEGNFIMVRLPISDSLAYRQLMTQGIMIRTMTGFRFPNFIRVTIASRPVMEDCMRALDHVMNAISPMESVS